MVTTLNILAVEETLVKENESQENQEINSQEVEESVIKPNATIEEPKKNITKVNCLMDKVYGPVEVRE